MAKSTLAQRRAARKGYQRAKKKPLGEGSRFRAIAKSAKLGGAKEPEAVAAVIGRKKYGPKKMARLAAQGRKKARK